MLLSVLLWTGIGFGAGSIPFAVILGYWIARTDVRRYGDGNPGTANAWQAGGAAVGLAVMFLDMLKGALPVALAHFVYGLHGWALVPVALAPVAGHAFSPFLRGRGGKAVAVTGGVWIGVLPGEALAVQATLLVLGYAVQTVSAWAVIFSMTGFLIYLVLRGADAALLALWVGNLAILLWKHRQELPRRPQLRSWLHHTP